MSGRTYRGSAGAKKPGGATSRRAWLCLRLLPVPACLVACLAAGCRSPRREARAADEAAYAIIRDGQQEALGRREHFTIDQPSETLRRRLVELYGLSIGAPAGLGSAHIDRPPQWPKGLGAQTTNAPNHTFTLDASGPIKLSLLQALKVAAANSHDYQQRKESVFRTALALDLAREAFRTTFAGTLNSLFSTDRSTEDSVNGSRSSGDLSLKRKLQSGAELTAQLGLDLVKLLSGDSESAFGIVADATVAIPLLRGARRQIVREPLTQAERDVTYAIWEFEEFKRSFAVRVAREYLSAVQGLDGMRNAEENNKVLVASSSRVRRMADAGRLPEIQVDQARQDELRAYDGLVRARQQSDGQLDAFKRVLGIPTDAPIELERAELDRLTTAARERGMLSTNEPAVGVSAELDYEGLTDRATDYALRHRRDLTSATGRVHDAQRAVVVAADALKPGVSLTGQAGAGSSRSVGSAGAGDARLDFGEGTYSALLNIDLPLERTAEAHALRGSLIDLEGAVRSYQDMEDDIKLAIRDGTRQLAQTRESMSIQSRSVVLARRRQRSTDLFLQAGRAEVRDLLEAQEALLSAQNALTAAIVNHRLAELGLQRDLGMLQVDGLGVWTEVSIEEMMHDNE